MEKIQKLIPLIKSYYNTPDPAHDWAHIGRVASIAMSLAKDMDVNIECVLAGVYCHDIVNLPKNHPDRKMASTMAAEKAEKYLIEAGFSDAEIAIIKKAVVEHSFSKGLKPSTLEAAIVQDADRLDSLGAIGILRCAAVNTQMQSTFYDPLDPLAEMRELDDKKFMLDHYYVKLYKLPELMNTPKAKEMAKARVAYMKEFISTLLNETHGKK